MLRRSDFMLASTAFSFVFANFGMAMAARIPMITTTISSSMSVKPLRFDMLPPVGLLLLSCFDRGLRSFRQRVRQHICHPPGPSEEPVTPSRLNHRLQPRAKRAGRSNQADFARVGSAARPGE